jgi:ribosomal protein S7
MLSSYKYKYFFFTYIFYKLLNKFSKKGNNYRIELLFENVLLNFKRLKKSNFFLIFLEALCILKPEVGVTIFKFAKNKNTKRKKKGSKLAIRVKVIPKNITRKSKYNMSLNWIYIKLKSGKPSSNFRFISNEFFDILQYKQSALSSKKKLHKLVLLNRGATHYRW